jgi:hypothetical protein
VSISSKLKSQNRIRGLENEKHFIRALASPDKKFSQPHWWFDLRGATKEEDRRGIDAVLTTDVGKIFFQIKSSRCGLDKHLNHRRSTFAIPLIINCLMTEEEIQKLAIMEAQEYRAKLICSRTTE